MKIVTETIEETLERLANEMVNTRGMGMACGAYVAHDLRRAASLIRQLKADLAKLQSGEGRS